MLIIQVYKICGRGRIAKGIHFSEHRKAAAAFTFAENLGLHRVLQNNTYDMPASKCVCSLGSLYLLHHDHFMRNTQEM